MKSRQCSASASHALATNSSMALIGEWYICSERRWTSSFDSVTLISRSKLPREPSASASGGSGATAGV